MGKHTTISKLDIANFTVFENQKFEFCSGVNLFIGENGVGKSHLFKVLYSGAYVSWKMHRLQEHSPETVFAYKLLKVYGRTSLSGGELIRYNNNAAQIVIEYSNATLSSISLKIEKGATLGSPPPAIGEEPTFIPPAEVLTQYQGFVYRHERGYESGDETYRDLCAALGGNDVAKLNERMEHIVAKIEEVIGGQVVLKNDQFYIKSGRRWLEAALAAEGHRRLAVISHLVKNGTIRDGSILFWDEPETNLNPKLIVKTVEIIRELAAAGVQVFVATHDFLVTNEFGLAVEYETEPKVPIKFFALSKLKKNGPTVHEACDKLQGLKNNAILEQFAAHYDRETALFETFSGHDHEKD